MKVCLPLYRRPLYTAHKASHPGAGFTLIELLVVIAIIAILAAILFPVFAQAREKARQTACLSNVKQIGTGIMIYVQDYDEKYPCNWYQNLWPTFPPSDTANAGRYKWMDAVAPYIKNEGVFTCPSDSTDRSKYVNNKSLTTSSENWGSYVTNTTYWDINIGTPPSSESNNEARQTTLADVKVPADTIWATEGNGAFQVAWPNIVSQPTTVRQWMGYDLLSLLPPTDPNFYHEGGIVARHQGRVNIIWCDGHAGTMDIKRIMTPGKTCNAAGQCAYKYLTIEDD